MQSTRTPLVIAVLALLAVAGFGPASVARGQTAGCDRMVGAEAGGEGATELIDSLAPGQTGCLRAGTYVADQFAIETPGIRLTSFPGERATLQGRLRIEASADGAVVEGLVLDGRNPGNLLGPLIYADGVTLRDNEITNQHTAICVHIDAYPGEPPPRAVVIEDNRIHDCGQLPATNHEHGIYVAQGSGTIIRGNWIYSNADRGVQLYPNADDSLVTANVIDGNGEGVIISGDSDEASDGNLVSDNVITNSTIRDNVESHWQGPIGSGNVVRDNCVFGGVRDDGDGGIGLEHGFMAVDNITAAPLYVDRGSANFDLRPNSPCLDRDSQQVVEEVRLSVGKRRVQAAGRLLVRGQISGWTREQSAANATIQMRRKRGWRGLAVVRVKSNARFSARVRVPSTRGTLRLRAKVRGAGGSELIKISVR